MSDFLYRHGGNIVHADQHTDREQGRFLQRVEFELGGFDIPAPRIADEFRPLAERFGMDWKLVFSGRTPRDDNAPFRPQAPNRDVTRPHARADPCAQRR